MVPLVEELAFRGYINAETGARDFENVPLGHFTWLRSSCPCLIRRVPCRWVEALAGRAMRSRSPAWTLADAVLAHMTTNALIATYVRPTMLGLSGRNRLASAWARAEPKRVHCLYLTRTWTPARPLAGLLFNLLSATGQGETKILAERQLGDTGS